jgi:hypothetical protein
MWKRGSALALVIVATLLLTFLSPFFPLRGALGQSSPTTTVSVQPTGTAGLTIGQQFSINITVSNVTDLYAWQFYLYYQSAVLNGSMAFDPSTLLYDIPEVTEGPFLQTSNCPYPYFIISNFTDYYNATYGFMYVSCTRYGNVGGVDGSGTLATVNFTAVGSGNSVLHLDDVLLLNSTTPFGYPIPFTPVDGWAYVGQVHVAVTDVDTPIDIPQGSMAYINVTTENQGGLPETFDVTLYDDANPIATQTVTNLPAGEGQTLNFAWDTTPIPIGEYTLNATATQVPGETDLAGKSLSVNVYVGTIDLAATNISPYMNSLPLGWPGTNVSVTVKNIGQETETFNVSLYDGPNLIDTQETALISGGTGTLTFTWDTSTLNLGNYTLTASIPPIPFDTDTADKNVSISVAVSIPGDVLGEGKVDMGDVVTILRAFASTPGMPNYNPNCDLEDTGRIDMGDVVIALRNFGQHYP